MAPPRTSPTTSPRTSIVEPDPSRQPAWLVLSQECDAPTLRAELSGVMRGESSDPDLRVVVDFRRTRFLPEAGEALAWLDEPPRPSISAR